MSEKKEPSIGDGSLVLCGLQRSIWRSAAEQFDETDDRREQSDAAAQRDRTLHETS
ncbi:zinc ring-type [Paraburkholderia caribensis MBA4]|uniref:Zinc ring-type n=1 Tax=Paraburkholderia caribensis MBA4 TaxID=1323664 RepID=A0A0P0RDX0_9BURK|nr:zinc ring-type [Paraburkholderia caribensis MBA4]